MHNPSHTILLNGEKFGISICWFFFPIGLFPYIFEILEPMPNQ